MMKVTKGNPLLAGIGVIGVCPLLAKSTTLLTGLVMGLVFLATLLLSVASVSSCRRFIARNFRLPAILLISTSWVTVFDLLMQAICFEMRETLGIYVPLLAMNSLILLSIEQNALTLPPASALLAVFVPGVFVLGIVVFLGAGRELLGQGTLIGDAGLLFPTGGYRWSITDGGYSLLNQAPGALLGLGLLLAFLKWLAPGKDTENSDQAVPPAG